MYAYRYRRPFALALAVLALLATVGTTVSAMAH
jgi:hypothetical protein